LGCQGHEIYEESWAGIEGDAVPHFPLSAAQPTTFPDLRPVILIGQDDEKMYTGS
jgi:hypothetical protein